VAVGPDLAVTTVSAPASTAAGAMITVTDTTKNQGGAAAAASSTAFYLSANYSFDAADTFLGSRTVPALTPGTSSTLSTTLQIPPTQPAGSYYVIAKADWDSAIQEGIETNNVRVSAAMAIGPDLIVSALTTPTAATAGGTYTVSDTTKNQGLGSAGETTTRFYLSANFALDASDQLIGSRTVPPLVAGASHQVTNTVVTIPASTAVGSYYIIAQADATGGVTETSETNNTRGSTLVAVGPDLVVTAVSAPASAAAGAMITVTDTTKNQGGAAGAASSTAFYLSANYTFDASDTFLGSRPVGALAASGLETASTPLQIPAGFPSGRYYVLARADWNAAVTETVETNNDRVSPTTVAIGGDLVVTAATVSATGKANGLITVTDTTANQGTTSLPASSTGFYLSTNSTFGTDDVFLGSRAVGTLAPLASESGSTQVTVPANTAPGSYFVFAVADWNNTVLEANEANNGRITSSVRIGPDLTVSALTAPTSAVAGSTISASDTTLNQGGDEAPASVTTFYLSINSLLDAADIAIGTREVTALGPGLSNIGSASLTIPASTAAMTYYIIARADGGDSIPEALETNNTRVRSITISAAPPAP
jgi:trimeric autotransporter adhesin